MEYEVPVHMKVTYVLTIILCLVGLISQNDTILASGGIIAVVLSAELEILEALHKLNQRYSNELLQSKKQS